MEKIISYDLNAPGKDYTALWAAIRALDPGARRILESVWWIRTGSTVPQVMERLKEHIDRNDGLLVAAVGEATCVNILE